MSNNWLNDSGDLRICFPLTAANDWTADPKTTFSIWWPVNVYQVWPPEDATDWCLMGSLQNTPWEVPLTPMSGVQAQKRYTAPNLPICSHKFDWECFIWVAADPEDLWLVWVTLCSVIDPHDKCSDPKWASLLLSAGPKVSLRMFYLSCNWPIRPLTCGVHSGGPLWWGPDPPWVGPSSKKIWPCDDP